MKKTIVLALGVLILMSGLYLVNDQGDDEMAINEEPVLETGKVEREDDIKEPKPVVPANLATKTFVGKLEEVNTGCFADGECYVVVDGQHVTTLVGRRQDMVGAIIGVDGFGDLEGFLGEEVEVFAVVGEEGGYTLYGDENLYVKLTKSGGTSTQINGLAEILGVSINPKTVLEDSRCPIDVNCIQAGTVRVEALVDFGSGAIPQQFTLGEAITTEAGSVTLVQVDPTKDTNTTLAPTDYVFYFKVTVR